MIDAPKTAARTPVRAAAKSPPQDGSVDVQEARFDQTMEERAELEREANALRDMMLEQLKEDDAALKKYIAMI